VPCTHSSAEFCRINSTTPPNEPAFISLLLHTSEAAAFLQQAYLIGHAACHGSAQCTSFSAHLRSSALMSIALAPRST
jgi:hypothetical protein